MEQSTLPATLYHYTDVRGLYGIIQDQAIWASNIRYLNDSQEFDYAVMLARGGILERAEATADQREKEVLTALGTRLSMGGIVDVFVASFSKEGDLLSQWRGYCPNGAGYSIGFVTTDLYREAVMQGFYLAQCLYEYEAQCEIIRDVLNAVISSEPWTRAFEELETDELYRRAAEIWCQRFMPSAPLIKHRGFQEEREWRLISRPISCTDPQWKVRSGRSILIPYVPITLRRFGPHLPLKEIIVGPTPHMELATRAVWEWLISKDISKTVQNSKVPYRSW